MMRRLPAGAYPWSCAVAVLTVSAPVFQLPMRMAEPMCSSALLKPARRDRNRQATAPSLTVPHVPQVSWRIPHVGLVRPVRSSSGKERRRVVTHLSGRSGEWWCCRLMWIWRTIRHAIRRLPRRPTPLPKHILSPRLECSCAEVGVWRVLRDAYVVAVGCSYRQA